MTNFDQVPEPRPLRSAHRTALRREMTTMVATTPRRWRRSSIAFVLTLATTAGGVGVAAAAIYVHYASVTNTSTAHCYSLAQVGDNGAAIAAVGAPESNAQVTDALGVCQMLWRDGFLTPGVTHAVHVTVATTVHSVPGLVVCTMPDGTAGVFPGTTSTCAKLGLAEPRPAVVAP
jgi:hypothetical protein